MATLEKSKYKSLFPLFQMLTAAFLLPFLVCGTAFFINFIAMGYHASRAIPFGTMVCNKLILSNTHLLRSDISNNLDQYLF